MPSTDNISDVDPNTIHTSVAVVPSLTAAQRRVAAALAEGHDATVIEITALADVSKSSVAKTLALLEGSGAALRTVREDDGIREADLWSPGPALGALLFMGEVEASRLGVADLSPTVTGMAVGLHLSGALTDGDAAEEADGRTAAVPMEVPDHAAAEGAMPLANPAAGGGARSGAEPQHVLAPVPSAESVAAVPVMNASCVPDDSAPGGRAGRLAPGELAAMVAAVLAAHPDIEYTPAMLSHLLKGRSPGAIHNVLEKMIKIGTAVRACDKPKRYRHATPQTSNGS